MFERVSPVDKILLSILVPALLITVIAFLYTTVSTGQFAFTSDVANFLKAMLILIAASTIGLVVRNIFGAIREGRQATRWQNTEFDRHLDEYQENIEQVSHFY